jgi:hypothetical protein
MFVLQQNYQLTYRAILQRQRACEQQNLIPRNSSFKAICSLTRNLARSRQPFTAPLAYKPKRSWI